MDEAFAIYIDRLRDGRTQKVEETVTPAFLDIHEDRLVCDQPVMFQGEAYIAESDLIVHLDVTTAVRMKCVICQDFFLQTIALCGLYITVPLEEIPSAVYDLSQALREEVILAIPHHMECHKGNCPVRKEIQPFLKKLPSQSCEGTTNQPFAGL